MTIASASSTRKEELLADLARTPHHAPDHKLIPTRDDALERLNALGTRIWLDTGDLEEASRLWHREMSALTTNNTLANQVVQTGVMDEVIREAARRIRDVEPAISTREMVLDIAFVVNCQIALRLVRAFDAFVSVELHPSIAHDVEKTVRYAQRYHSVKPDRFIVKIPLTPEGYCAVARVRAEGIPVNYTLGFSARQNYLAALLSRPNYVNVFLGRLNAVVADNGLGDGKYVGEKTTIASQRAVKRLRKTHHDIPTLQIAASMRNAEQIVSLAGVDVFTIPPKAVDEFLTQRRNPGEIVSKADTEYEVTLAPDADADAIGLLWNIDDRFVQFGEQLAARGGTHLSGDDLRSADRDFNTGLFTDFTDEEKLAIRSQGKIPELARWKGRAAIDDLMTESALQSFTADQTAFDNHIRAVLGA